MGELKRLTEKVKGTLFSLVLSKRFYFSHEGFCPCCDRDVTFVSYNQWLRDHFICSNCKSLPRERALMVVIEKTFPKWQELHIHESSPVARGASKKLKENSKHYISSQYYPSKTFGVITEKEYNEDLENQTFSDQSFDLVVTQDVMEHLYNPEKAFKEIARTLKPGGAHIFTVPIINKFKKSEVWATLKDGKPNFLHNPEYHGNPVDPKGSPVTMHWGYDIKDFIYNESGLDTTIEYIDNLDMGIRAEYIEVLVSKKV